MSILSGVGDRLAVAFGSGVALGDGPGSGLRGEAMACWPSMMAYVPFLDPLPAGHDWWWLSAPVLCLGIAMVYKAYRMPSLDGYCREVAIMAGQILLALLLFAVGLGVLVMWVVPQLPVPS